MPKRAKPSTPTTVAKKAKAETNVAKKANKEQSEAQLSELKAKVNAILAEFE